MKRDMRLVAARRLVVLVPALAAALLAGCSGGSPFQKKDSIEEGTAAARREAEAAAAAQAAAGDPGLQGTSSTIPSLVPGEGRVVLPAPDAPPPTAPPEDQFDDDNPQHLLARCRDRSARQQWFDAVGDCRRASDLDPKNIEPQVELMRLLVTLQSYSDAEKSARAVIAARPNDPVAWYYLAWSYRGRDEYPQAIDALGRAVALDPKRVEFVQALGLTYCLAENFGKGIETLEQALAMRPGDAKIQAMITEARAQLAEKLAPYLKLVREHPESYDNHAALGFMYQKYGLSQHALKAYDSALAKIPVPLPEQDAETKKIAAQIYYNRGAVYRELGRPDLAEAAVWQSMQLDPTLGAVGWYMIGLSRYDAGKYEPAIEALRRSIDLEPNVAENRLALADAYDKAGRGSEAREQRNAARAIRERRQAEKDEITNEYRAREQEEEAKAAAAAAATAPAAPAATAVPPVADPVPAAAPAASPAAPAGDPAGTPSAPATPPSATAAPSAAVAPVVAPAASPAAE